MRDGGKRHERGQKPRVLHTPTRRARRGLTEEELALWAEVARTVRRRRGVAPPPEPPPAPPSSAPVIARAEPSPRPAPPPLAQLERKLKRELSRGRGPIDASLDLHGLTQVEAFSALREFLGRAQTRGDRLVIVVTGKGKAFSDEPGVLKRLTPLWLRAPELRNVVLGFEEAQRHHGGTGALYVRLRRRRVD
jgi:DNA-nicking Smr family endonuclease